MCRSCATLRYKQYIYIYIIYIELMLQIQYMIKWQLSISIIWIIYIYSHHRVTALSLTKLEYNWSFLVEFFATFAPVGAPSFSKFKAMYCWGLFYLYINCQTATQHQSNHFSFFPSSTCKAVFYVCALRYGFFPARTIKKAIKAWSPLNCMMMLDVWLIVIYCILISQGMVRVNWS